MINHIVQSPPFNEMKKEKRKKVVSQVYTSVTKDENLQNIKSNLSKAPMLARNLIKEIFTQNHVVAMNYFTDNK